MTKLIIDIGNTCCKWAIYTEDHLLTVRTSTEFTPELVGRILGEFRGIKEAILSSVRDFPNECRDLLAEYTDFFIELSHTTPVPIVNRYKTPQTLGLDRLAAAVGAGALYPGKPVLVIDAGTAITIDLLSPANEFLGGNISPGIETRFKALRQFTGKLPLVTLADEFEKLGTDTNSAIRAGVQQGVIFELHAYIRQYSGEYPELIILLTGGHATFLKKHLPPPVRLAENLTLTGLHRILTHNSLS